MQAKGDGGSTRFDLLEREKMRGREKEGDERERERKDEREMRRQTGQGHQEGAPPARPRSQGAGVEMPLCNLQARSCWLQGHCEERKGGASLGILAMATMVSVKDAHALWQ